MVMSGQWHVLSYSFHLVEPAEVGGANQSCYDDEPKLRPTGASES